jgi:dsDNA-specific endonuclease/ATPase MutS2
MSGPEHRDERVEELLRANERLAAEVRNLSLGNGEAPRPAAMPTARRLGRQSAERDAAGAQRDAMRAERDAVRTELEAVRRELGTALDSTRGELEQVARHRAGLEQQNQELAREVSRLSAGFPGLLRRLRGRLSKS